MKSLPMSEFRKQPGEYLLDVIRDGKSYLLTKAGKPAACLVPVGDADVRTVIRRDGSVEGQPVLTMKRARGAKKR